MSYYEDLLSRLSIPELAVDCARCTDLFKCCTYRPFIANFLAGQIGEQLNQFDLHEWDFTICGLSPNLQYRKQFKGKSGWGFGTEESLLCSFYNRGNGGCHIWQNRPGVCRTFFCKSSYFEEGQNYWNKAEELTWFIEWLLVEDFLHEKGWTIDEIQVVKAYLHENALKKKVHLTEGMLFENKSQANLFYKEAADYVKSLEENYICDLLGKDGSHLLEQVLALKEKLG